MLWLTQVCFVKKISVKKYAIGRFPDVFELASLLLYLASSVSLR